MFCILHRRKLDNNIKLDAFSARSSEIRPPTQALQTGRRERGADVPRTRQLDSLRFFRRHLCPVTLTYCNAPSAIGRSSDFDRQVCRGRDSNKKREKIRGGVKIKKGWVLKKQSREQRSVFYGPKPWIWFRFTDTKSTYLYRYKLSYVYI